MTSVDSQILDHIMNLKLQNKVVGFELLENKKNSKSTTVYLQVELSIHSIRKILWKFLKRHFRGFVEPGDLDFRTQIENQLSIVLVSPAYVKLPHKGKDPGGYSGHFYIISSNYGIPKSFKVYTFSIKELHLVQTFKREIYQHLGLTGLTQQFKMETSDFRESIELLIYNAMANSKNSTTFKVELSISYDEQNNEN